MDSLCALRLPKGHSSLQSARAIDIVDCLQLPHVIQWHTIGDCSAAFDAIKSMKIRGAPAIASLAAVAIACELLNALDSPTSSTILQSQSSLQSWLNDRATFLLSSRPTAVNLREAMHRLQHLVASSNPEDVSTTARKIAQAGELVWTEDIERNVRIGDNGAQWLLDSLERDGSIQRGGSINVLTVCNTGSLATSVSRMNSNRYIVNQLYST